MVLTKFTRYSHSSKPSGQLVSVKWALSVVFIMSVLSYLDVHARFSQAKQVHAFAKKEKQPNSKLRTLRIKMQRLQHDLTKKRKQKNISLAELATVEKKLQATLTVLATNKNKREDLGKKLDQLGEKKRAVTANLASQREVLQQLAKQVFVSGQQVPAKIWLSNYDRNSIQRSLLFHRYIEKQRNKKIRNLMRSLETLEGLGIQVKEQQQRLDLLSKRNHALMQQFRAQRKQRAFWLEKLNSKLQLDQQKLVKLKLEESELKQVMSVLITRRIRVKKLINTGGFRKLKGRLSWPSLGRIHNRFNKGDAFGKLHAKGVLISAPAGSKVSAVADGKVVFANWLRGYGLIIIIDHGGSYFSLYGHAQKLYKNVGQSVESGELIARVGDTGGISKTALYFEIRRQGVALNPLKWCKTSQNK